MKDVVDAVEAAYVARGRGGAPVRVDHDETLVLGAAGAISSKFLAVGTPRSIGFIGCGALARALLDAHKIVFGAAAPRELRCAGDGADAFGGRVTSIAEACACDIVCVTDPAAAPGLQRAWFRRGTHVITFGALDPDVLDGAKITYDDQPGGWGTLGEVAAGIKDGRELDEVTVYLAPVQDRKRDH